MENGGSYLGSNGTEYLEPEVVALSASDGYLKRVREVEKREAQRLELSLRWGSSTALFPAI